MLRITDGMLDCVMYLKYVLLCPVVSPHGVSERMFQQACCVMTARAGHGKCLICDKKVHIIFKLSLSGISRIFLSLCSVAHFLQSVMKPQTIISCYEKT